jgi:hypothetical protein
MSFGKGLNSFLALVVILSERERELGGGKSPPRFSPPLAVFRYPLCGALPRNAPKDIAQKTSRAQYKLKF